MMKTAQGNWLVLAGAGNDQGNEHSQIGVSGDGGAGPATTLRIGDPVMAHVIIGGAVVARMCRMGH